MAACCIAMLLPIAVLLIGGGSLTGLSGNLWVALPLVLCLAMHFFMHRATGRSCHGKPDGKDASGPGAPGP